MPAPARYLWALVVLCAILAAQSYAPPAGSRPALRRYGPSILPGGRIVAPLGEEYVTGPGAFGLAVSSSGGTVVTANLGPATYSFTVLERDHAGRFSSSRQVVARPPATVEEIPSTPGWQGVSLGVALSGDHNVWLAEGNSGSIAQFDSTDERRHVINLNRDGFRDSYSGDLAFDSERNLLYAADQANFRVAVIDLHSRQVIASVRVGRLPFVMALSPDRHKLYVTNAGMFEYRLVPGLDPARLLETGLPFPAAPGGLGDANAPESNSVSIVDVSNPGAPKVEATVRTGTPVGRDIYGGSSPSGIVATADRVFVSNSADDSVSIIDAHTNAVEGEIPIRVPGLESLRGVLPIGLAYHQRSGWLLVAEAGINAVGVIDVRQKRVLGHLPAGWFPTRVALDGDSVLVANAKGHGVGPNSAAWAHTGQLYQGTLSVFPLPGPADLPVQTRLVMELSGLAPREAAPATAAPLPDAIRHVVLIVKESRSYDEILGDIVRGSNGPAMGQPSLARFGTHGSVDGRHQRLSFKDVELTPNQHDIARRWAMSDNFYSDAETSIGGHHWLVDSYPNAWTETSLLAAYGNQKDFRPGPAPGRLSFAGLAASVQPEDLNEAGALWHHLARHGITFLNFGEGFELPGIGEGRGMEPTGARFAANVPMPEPLYANTVRDYPGFNLNISDQYRATQFIRTIEERYVKPGAELPGFIFIHLPGDYLAAPRPSEGYPYEESYLMDNDYALGRILEYLSRTKWWPQMAVFITEASAQGGVDHIDSHRTILLCASPWSKPGYISHTNTSYPGLFKTIFRLLDLPPLNLFDATAADLSDCFASVPDASPYHLIPVDRRIFPQ